MAIQTIVSLSINLLGDGTSTTFTIPLANLTPAQQSVLFSGAPASNLFGTCQIQLGWNG